WVLVHAPALDFRTDEGRRKIEALTDSLAAVPNVHEVRSLSRPLGRPAKTFVQQLFLQGIRQTGLADPRYVSLRPPDRADRGHITRLEVVFETDPFSPGSLNTLEEINERVAKAVAPGGALAGVQATGLTGPTALVSDLRAVTTLDERRMYVLVTLGVYLILVALLRRPGICLYLIATVVLGYLASLGLTEIVFRNPHQGPGPGAGLDWKVGFFLFVILVAVGEDYNIFLMSRVVEEERRHGPIEGTRLAVAHTGGIISSCGLIMAGTFLAMLTGSLTALR